MSWLQSIIAVIAGFFVTALLSTATDTVMQAIGVFPSDGQRMSDAMFLLPAVYRALYTVAGGFITAKFAPTKPMHHAAVLAGLGLLGGLGGLAAWYAAPNLGPFWYAASIPASALPCILGGAWLATKPAGDTDHV